MTGRGDVGVKRDGGEMLKKESGRVGYWSEWKREEESGGMCRDV